MKNDDWIRVGKGKEIEENLEGYLERKEWWNSLRIVMKKVDVKEAKRGDFEKVIDVKKIMKLIEKKRRRWFWKVN